MDTKDERFYLGESVRRAFPLINALAQTIEVQQYCKSPNWDLIQRDFDALICSQEIQEILLETLRQFSQDEFAQPRFLSITSEEWYIIDVENFAVRAFVARPAAARTFSSSKYDCLVGNLSGPTITLHLSAFPADANPGYFKMDTKLVSRETIELEKGSSILVQAGKIVPQQHIHAPTIVVIAYQKCFQSLAWVFDSETHRALLATATHDRPIRLQAGADFLRALHRTEDISIDESVKFLTALAADTHYFVRWSAIQALCEIDFDVGHPFLLQGIEDAHPAVAMAARKALTKLSVPLTGV